MPSPLVHIQPKFQLQPIELVSPGFRGLNTVQSGSLLDPSYCTAAQNAILDSSGRLAARAGVARQTVTPVTGSLPILTSFEYNGGASIGKLQLVAWNGGISTNISNPSSANIIGTTTQTNGNWWFHNFNNKVIGFQAGGKPAVWNGTGNFANIVESSGTAPTGGIGTAAFGRVWGVQTDLQTIQYSGLLNETDWGSLSAGLIDMRTIWSDGTDQVVGICGFNSSLVVFGQNHIVFFTDGRGSMLGLDPTQAYVFDIVSSSGLYSQQTLQPIGEGDILFVGNNGVQSISQLQTERSYPMANVSKYVRDSLLAQVANESPTAIRSSYNNLTGFYLLSLPTSNTVWCLDQRRPYQDEAGEKCAIVTTWTMTATAMHSTVSNLTYIARTPGYIGLYGGNTDEGNPFTFTYLSGWLNLGEQIGERLKMLKRFELIAYTSGNTTLTLNWNVDFGNNQKFGQISIPATGVSTSQYGVGQYGLSQYGGSQVIALLKFPSRARGQYYQVGVTTSVVAPFSLQQIQLATKIGRVA